MKGKVQKIARMIIIAAWILGALVVLTWAIIIKYKKDQYDKATILTYQLNETGDGYILTKCKQGEATKVEIPSTYNELPVTSVGGYAFSGCSNLTEIVIPDSVTSIGGYAFYNCSSLTGVTISENSQLTDIGYSTFYNCNSLTEIIIPNRVTNIGGYAFNGCSSLTGVYITDVAAWCNISFEDISGNPLYYANNLYLNNELVTELIIPDGVMCVGDFAFYNCSSLTGIVIPDSVTSIGRSAFSSCSGLTIYCEVERKPSEWSWNSSECPVVWDCKNNDVADDGYIYTVIDSLRYGVKDGVATIVRQPSTLKTANILVTITYKNLEYSVTSIADAAFRDCSSLTSVTFGENSQLTNIGNRTFYHCSSLAEIVIPDSVTSIGDDAFSGCYRLTICCETERKPSGWDLDWNSSSRPVIWGYKGE